MSFQEWWIANKDLYAVSERTAYIIWCAAQQAQIPSTVVSTEKWPNKWPETVERYEQSKLR